MPRQQCSTSFKVDCVKVPKERCRTVKELVCEPKKETVPQKKVIRSCSWPPKKHHDKFCTRLVSPVGDIFAAAGSEI